MLRDSRFVPASLLSCCVCLCLSVLPQKLLYSCSIPYHSPSRAGNTAFEVATSLREEEKKKDTTYFPGTHLTKSQEVQDPPSLGAPCNQSYRTGTVADTRQLLLVLEPRALLPAPHERCTCQTQPAQVQVPPQASTAAQSSQNHTIHHALAQLLTPSCFVKKSILPRTKLHKRSLAKETVSRQRGGQPGRWGCTSSGDSSAAEFQLHNSATPHRCHQC